MDCQVENKLTFTVSVVLAEGIKNTLKAEPGIAAVDEMSRVVGKIYFFFSQIFLEFFHDFAKHKT